jgi:hypothetical protein
MGPIEEPTADLSLADRSAEREKDALEAPWKGGSRIQSYTYILITAWTLIIAISLGWNLYQARQEIQAMALVAAQINYDKDLLYRGGPPSMAGSRP